jgi:mobilization protein NikA
VDDFRYDMGFVAEISRMATGAIPLHKAGFTGITVRINSPKGFEQDFASNSSFLLYRKYLTASQLLCITLSVKIGRPTLPARERQSRLVALRFTPDELREVKQAAKAAKLSVSQYIRMKLGLRGDK